MNIELYQEIALACNLPEHQLKQGDIATLIDFVPHPTGGETGYVLEIFLVPNKFVSSCISKSFLLKGFTKKHTSSIVFCTFR